MVRLLPESDGALYAFEISGQLTSEDVESMNPYTDDLFARFRRIKMLCVLNDFVGFTPQGDWARTKWIFEFMDKVDCLAIVGPEEDGHALAMAVAAMGGVPVEVFSSGERKQALDWLGTFSN